MMGWSTYKQGGKVVSDLHSADRGWVAITAATPALGVRTGIANCLHLVDRPAVLLNV